MSIGAALPQGTVSATVTGLRSDKGEVLACLTAKPAAFPHCERDAAAHSLAVPAGRQVELDFGEVAEGTYAISLIHDENANGRLDKVLLAPREGFGFSENAPVAFGPPRFKDAAFPVGAGGEHQTIRMRYLF